MTDFEGHGLIKAERLRALEERLLALARTGGATMAELARDLGVSRQTIWRDITALSKTTPMVQDGPRFWIDPVRYVTHTRFTVGESLMLYLAARRAVRQTSSAPPVMISALNKLTLALKGPTGDQLAASTRLIEQERAADAGRVAVWETLIRAWIEQITVRIVYRSFKRKELRTYEYQPYLFEPVILSEGVYVVGYSLTHKAIRTLKVERIVRASLTTQPFERPDDLSIDDLLRHAWGIWYGDTLTEVRLWFHPRVAQRVKETLWHPTQKITDRADGSVEWCAQLAGTQELVPWIRGWGPDVEVLAPPALREAIANDMRRAAAVYEANEGEAGLG